MNTENHLHHAKLGLDMAQKKIKERNFLVALASLVKTYVHTRKLIELVYEAEREAASAERTTGD